MDDTLLIFVIIVYLLSSILTGVWIAGQKNRGTGEAVVLGILFGPFGCIMEALLPTLPDPGRKLIFCPHCAEKVYHLAKVCKNCGRDIAG